MTTTADGAGNDARPREAGDEKAGRVTVLGSIGAPFGVHGWVKVRSYTEPLDNILNYGVWLLGREGRWQAVEVRDSRVTGKGVLAKLAGIDTPEEARRLTGVEVGVARSDMPQLPPGEHYWSDLEGLQALGNDGIVLGRVDHFRSTPAGTLVVVKGEREHWIPFVKDRIVQVDLDAGRIVFDWAVEWS